MNETIDELKAGWERVREQVKALQLTAQFYAERNQQLIDENRELKSHIEAADRSISDLAEVQVEMNELLWWVTALAWVEVQPDAWLNAVAVSRMKLQQLLATQGYTREGLEKQ